MITIRCNICHSDFQTEPNSYEATKQKCKECLAEIRYGATKKYPKQTELLPMGSNQAMNYGDQIQKRISGHFSVGTGTITNDTKLSTDPSIRITTRNRATNELEINFDGFRNQEERTNREIFNGVQADYPEAELSIKSMTTQIPVKNLSSIEDIVTSDYIYLDFNKTQDWGKRLSGIGVKVNNTFDIIHNQLYNSTASKNRWKSTWSRHLRGTTSSGLPYQVLGTQLDLVKGKYRMEPLFHSHQIVDLQALHKDIMTNTKRGYYTRDIAIPTSQNIIYGNQIQPIATYNLFQRSMYEIAIPWE
jgi:hypothetical protein